MNENKYVIFYRHGETDMNIKDITMGQMTTIDTIFTEKGYQQIDEISKNMSENNIDIVYSSDSKRALETAKIAINKMAKTIPLKIEKNFCGLNVGIFQGTLYKDFVSNADVQNSFKNNSIKFPNGESINDLNFRLISCIKDICENSSYKRIAIVSHSAAISNLRMYIMKDNYVSLRMCCFMYKNGNIEVIDYVPSKNSNKDLVILKNE